MNSLEIAMYAPSSVARRLADSPPSRRIVLLTAGLALLTGSLAAQPTIPTSGTYRALLVFVRFQDDAFAYDNPRTAAADAWASPGQLPPFAHSLLARAPEPPFPETSLTDYFFRQSRERFTLYGSAFPRVLNTAYEENAYADEQRLDLTRLTQEILDSLNAEPSLDLSDYDANQDGVLDYLFIVLRRTTVAHLFRAASGVSDLGYVSEAPEYGASPGSLKKAALGAYVRYGNAGNIFPEVDLVRLLAHEFAHDLWQRERHVYCFNSPFGVPANNPACTGYALLAGGGLCDTRGDATISAFERDRLGDGWIACRPLTTDGTYPVTDLYSDTTANCYTLRPLPHRHPDGVKTVYVTNRQRIGPFDQLRTNTRLGPPVDRGLMTTGLLVAVTNPWWQYAVLAADNTLVLSDDRRTYEGDLYEGDRFVQLTPWTRPSISGYTTYPDNLILSDEHFQALDNIRYTGGPDGEMAFDYVGDFRRRPVIRQDSWIGREMTGYVFTGEVVVTRGSTLYLEAGLSFASVLRIEGGSTVVVEAGREVTLAAGSVLEMAPEARLVVRGRLRIEGSAGEPYRGQIEVAAGGTLIAEDVPTGATRDREATPGGVDVNAYPNPFHPTTTIRYVLPADGPVTLTIYDVLGRRVATLVDGYRPSGVHEAAWSADGLAAGPYLYRLEAGTRTRTGKVLLQP